MNRAELVARLRAAGCVWAEVEAELLLTCPGDTVEGLVRRREAGEPLEQVLGWASFCGLRIAVAPGVFVPRRRTEALVHLAARRSPARPVVLDLCTGTGALGAAFATLVPVRELHVADVDPVALACARSNLPRGTFVHRGDLFAALPDTLRGRIDVLLANAPYVPTDELGLLPAEARDHEPAAALDGGHDGLDLHRRIVAEASRWLAPGGSLYVETGSAQRPVVMGLMTRCGLVAEAVTADDAGGAVVLGTCPPAGPHTVAGPTGRDAP